MLTIKNIPWKMQAALWHDIAAWHDIFDNAEFHMIHLVIYAFMQSVIC